MIKLCRLIEMLWMHNRAQNCVYRGFCFRDSTLSGTPHKITEGSAVQDESSHEIDFQFFGLVDGFEKELGYFNLSELEEVTGPLGLPIERDLWFEPKTLEEIAPDKFKEVKGGE